MSIKRWLQTIATGELGVDCRGDFGREDSRLESNLTLIVDGEPSRRAFGVCGLARHGPQVEALELTFGEAAQSLRPRVNQAVFLAERGPP